MTSASTMQPVPLPRGWTEHVKSALLHAISIAASALTVARSQVASGRSKYNRLQAELDQAQTEIALLREELAMWQGKGKLGPTQAKAMREVEQRIAQLELGP